MDTQAAKWERWKAIRAKGALIRRAPQDAIEESTMPARRSLRATCLLGAILLAGCASHRGHVGYCSVLQYGGKLGAPYGLVTLAPELEDRLRAQLPSDTADDYLCWYASGDEIIAANRGGGGVSGVVFRRSGDDWVLLDDDYGLLLQLPSH